MSELKKKVFVTGSLSGAFNLAHRKGVIHEFPAKQADEIVELNYGTWPEPESKPSSSKKKKAEDKPE